MKGSLQALTDVSEGKDGCLVILVYQRNHDWRTGNCARLFDELLDVIRFKHPNYFSGFILHKVESAICGTTVIGALQCLITATLLFATAWLTAPSGLTLTLSSGSTTTTSAPSLRPTTAISPNVLTRTTCSSTCSPTAMAGDPTAMRTEP